MAAVPAGVIAERRVVTRLMLANAVSADTATPLDGLRWVQARRLAKLVEAGVVRESQPGRYYLEIPALAERMTARRQRVAIATLLVFGALFVIFYMTGRSFIRF